MYPRQDITVPDAPGIELPSWETAQPALAVVIVAYNCLPLLSDCLSSLPASADSLSYEIIVVDNDSSDGTYDWLQDVHPEVRAIRNATNMGFAKACNQGIRVARGDYLLLLNPDTTVHPGTIRKTYDYMVSSPRMAASGCKILRPDGSLDLSCKRSFPSPWDALCRMAGLSKLFPMSAVFARYDARYLDEDESQEVPLIDGCYMMIRRGALDDVGLLDERFFMYAEEMDWCWRAHQRGWSIGYDPSGSIVHTKGQITRRSPFRMLYHFHRSMALYCAKRYGKWNPLLLVIYPGIALRLAALIAQNLLRKNRQVNG